MLIYKPSAEAALSNGIITAPALTVLGSDVDPAAEATGASLRRL